MGELSHFDENGTCRMVDVGSKQASRRTARATALVRMQPNTLSAIRDLRIAKGNVFEVARLAGIMAAKRTADLIPLCHPLPLESIALEMDAVGNNAVRIEATVQTTAKTGVEMEALTAASAAALTIYDMCKSIDRGMIIAQIQLEEKSGGKSPAYTRVSD